MFSSIRFIKAIGFFVLVVPMFVLAQPIPLEDVLKERSTSSEIFNKTLRGEVGFDAKNPAHLKAVDVNARFFVYRVTRPEIQSEPGKMDSIFKEFESVLKQLKTKADNPFNTSFLEKILEKTKEVIPNTSISARINAVRMQAMCPAEIANCDLAGQKILPDQFMESFISILQKSPDDGMKLYALKGIRDTYKVIRPLATVKKASSRVTLNPAVEVKVAESLAQIIETPTVYPAGTAPEIVEGYRVLRREALKALAQSRAPISGQKGKTAFILAKFANGSDIKPEPRLDERAEAAIGLLNLRIQDPDASEYNMEAALYQFSSFLVDYFQRFNSRNDSDAEKLFPWKYYAARITDSLDELNKEVKNVPYAVEMVQKIGLGLSDMEKLDKAAVPQLANFVQAKAPASLLIYKKIPGTEVKLHGN
ncbi:MAG: hypothetical protein EBT92_04520 [Planctomycetes bacterium]|nr:hypothetical protein [Planctomycetota bacterium]NBY01723.1 hypothetical protein [Planctomycetota bacterium]